MSFDNWKRRLSGDKTVKAYTSPQEDDEGFYRRPITEMVLGPNGKTNGQKRIVGWEPVAYVLKDGVLTGIKGSRILTPDEVADEGLWSWVCRHPIPRDWFVGAIKGEPWPDASPAAAFNKDMQQAAGDGRSEQQKALDKMHGVEPTIGHNNPPALEPHIEHGEAILNAIKAAKDLDAKDEASAAVVLGAMNRIAELRLAATKAGKAIYQPIYQQYKAAMGKWTPMIEEAEGWEKVLNKRYLTWKTEELRKAVVAKRISDEAQRILDEQNERAADRAIARGEPEPEPERSQDAAVPPAAPVTATYRAAGQRTAPKEVERWHFDAIDDYDAVYAAFKTNADVRAVLLKVATQAVKQGQEVPGTRRHFGLI